jgi:hypothetical protein
LITAVVDEWYFLTTTIVIEQYFLMTAVVDEQYFIPKGITTNITTTEATYLNRNVTGCFIFLGVPKPPTKQIRPLSGQYLQGSILSIPARHQSLARIVPSLVTSL